MMKSFLLVLACLISFKLTAQTTYYLSSKGNDNNDGKTVSTTWKTIKTVEPGCTYLLKRGDTFHFNLLQIKNPEKKPIKIAAYGKGNKPVIDLYKRIVKGAWIQHAANIWKVNLKDTANYTGYRSPKDTNVGFIKVNGKIKGNKLKQLDELRMPWDFFSDETYLYVFSEADPGKTNAIDVVTNQIIIILSDGMTLSNLALKGTGAHAVQGRNASGIKLLNLDISEIGGSFLPRYKAGTTRYGNGIELGSGATNCLIEYCNVSEVYDAAFTMQSTDQNVVFNNVTFRNNKADRNEQSFEFWALGPSSKFVNCRFINNYCSNAGFGWSHEVRPDKNAAVHILNYYHAYSTNDITISNNTFVRGKTGYIYINPNADDAKMFKSFNNKIFLNKLVPIRTNDSTYKLNNTDQFRKHFGLEKGSIFKLLRN